MSRFGLLTWKLSVSVFSKIIRDKILYRKCANQYSISSIRQVASLTKVLQTSKHQTEVASDSDSSDSDDEKSEDLTDFRLQILKAGLDFVPQHGWSKQSIALGAQSLGLSSSSHTLIEDGSADLVHYFNFLCNEKLEDYLKEKYSSNKEKVNIQHYIEDALTHRLNMIIPYVSKWPEAMALMVSPLQFPTDSKNLLDLVDRVWYLSGDRSLDLTWYSKRVSLALAYRMCELSLLQDKSPEYSDTFEFLQRRVENIVNASEFIDNVANSTKHLPDLASGALITARNILGLNQWFSQQRDLRKVETLSDYFTLGKIVYHILQGEKQGYSNKSGFYTLSLSPRIPPNSKLVSLFTDESKYLQHIETPLNTEMQNLVI
ncbi:Ubiquinone biosynthesis protein COQ9, mitochondrial [Araneus ventricosus]|uniref:Ubiquinone biosynthesis protein n=1 Tax=Araneus ventricosus TaxID=182803 RepID=A0A4Y2CZI2_ARAVE|nr:Ubiquinone biosynthesis protein COQ9, mitochondrial [Araneus ventricosus]